jgi:hypothetical protein
VQAGWGRIGQDEIIEHAEEILEIFAGKRLKGVMAFKSRISCWADAGGDGLGDREQSGCLVFPLLVNFGGTRRVRRESRHEIRVQELSLEAADTRHGEYQERAAVEGRKTSGMTERWPM